MSLVKNNDIDFFFLGKNNYIDLLQKIIIILL